MSRGRGRSIIRRWMFDSKRRLLPRNVRVLRNHRTRDFARRLRNKRRVVCIRDLWPVQDSRSRWDWRLRHSCIRSRCWWCWIGRICIGCWRIWAVSRLRGRWSVHRWRGDCWRWRICIARLLRCIRIGSGWIIGCIARRRCLWFVRIHRIWIGWNISLWLLALSSRIFRIFWGSGRCLCRCFGVKVRVLRTGAKVERFVRVRSC